MKNISRYALVCAIVLPATAMAEMADDWKSRCKTLEITATSTMKARQRGVPLSSVMEIADGNELLEQLAIMAYDQPRFSSPELQEDSVSKFVNQLYLGCIKEFRK